MSTASVIITALAVMCLLVTSVTCAVLIFRTLQEVARDRRSSDERHDEQLERLLDRFQAIRWEDLATLRAVQDSADEEGGFFEPEDQLISSNGQVLVEDDNSGLGDDGDEDEEFIDQWVPGQGSLIEANRRVQLLEQQAMLEEDFPDEDRRSN